ncbi:PHP domain-containing protein [Lysinibacillus sp. NPDC093692]|uniref:PHP domain-containing protein n=1 Tax=Lysinibacillus sp. NPDC093692 TaxID=3390578 RepID=UPI003CFE0D45
MCKTCELHKGDVWICTCEGECTCRIELHAHTDVSNIRLLDSINSVKELIQTAWDIGLKGLAITDHEALSAHVKAIQTVRELKEKGKIGKDFKLILGNEIYLVNSLEEVRDNYQSGVTKFPHYLLLAKNKEGHEALRILSSKAWENSFYTGTMERVPTVKKDLEAIVKQFPNTLIATTACLGSESSYYILEADKARLEGDVQKKQYNIKKLMYFIEWNIELHGKDNFYLELQPSADYEQSTVNKVLIKLARKYGLKLIITNDAHYLRPEDMPIHGAYLNSKQDERETDSFYAHTYLHKASEIYAKMSYLDKGVVKEALKNTMAIGKMICDYTIEGDTIIPVAKLPEFEVAHLFKGGYKKYGYIEKMAHSDNEQDRYLLHLIEKGFKEKIPYREMSKEAFHEVMARINIELEELWEMSIILNQSMASYYVTVAKIIELIWGDDCGEASREEGSIVGAGRGSAVAFLINYLTDVTQVNPMLYGIEVPHWRHLHKSKPDISALDIDIDVTSTKKGFLFDRMRDFFGKKQVIQVCTFGTEKAKSAVQTACRGLSIDRDVGLYIASLIPVERGDMWPLKDCLYGNEEKGRKPIKQLIDEIDMYPRLRETALKIEGLINKRSIHAGGVLVLNEEYTKMNAMMKAPNGTPITQFNLNDSQACGAIKFDILTIEGNDKIQECMELLLKYGEIEWQGTLRKTFHKYFHPEIIDKSNPELFKMIGEDKIVDLFQFSTQLGQAVIKKAQPRSLIELVSLNSIMRLMSEGEEQPIDTFIRYKNDINLWYEEMRQHGLTKKEVAIFEKYLKALNGVADTQEAVMLMAMDENIAGFTVKEANYLRKGIAKKKADVQEEVKQKLFLWGRERGTRDEVIDYLWLQISRMLGYAFSIPHTLAYTLIAMVEANLSYNYNPLYWQTACLTVNSGSLEVEEDAKQKSTNYGKVAEAIGKMKGRGINISQPLINRAEFGFVPDIANDRIIFSIKGIVGIGDEVAHTILANRPFASFEDFYERMYVEKRIQKKHVIQLIKAGAFNEFGQPRYIMRDFLLKEIGIKESLNMQNMKSIIDLGLLDNPDLHIYKELFNFKEYISKSVVRVEKASNKCSKTGFSKDKILGLDEIAKQFYEKTFDGSSVRGYNYVTLEISEKQFTKEYNEKIKPFKELITTKEFIKLYNEAMFKREWYKTAKGSVSKWEMDSISYYENDHELINVNMEKYNIVNFFELDEKPVVVGYSHFKDNNIHKQKVFTIVGTVLDRNKTRHTITVLTPHGVVTVKTYAGAFAHYDKQISRKKGEKKEVIEKSWFTRGNLVLLNGFRREEQFVLKTYKVKGEEVQHTVNLILGVEKNGDLILQDERARAY